MKRLLLSLALLGGAMTVRPATAQDAEEEERAALDVAPLRLEEVMRTATERLPAILAAQADIDAADAEYLAAEGSFDPTWRTSANFIPVSGYPSWQVNTVIEQPTPLWGASLYAGYRIGLGDYPVYDGKLETNDYGEVRAGVRVPVLRDGPIDRRRASIARAEIGVDIARLGRDQQVLEVSRAAGLRYWDWVAAGERARLVQRWADAAAERDAQIRRRVRAGELPEIDIIENARTLQQRRASLAQAERGIEQAAIELGIFYRSSTGPTIVASARLPSGVPAPVLPVFQTDAVSRALAARPELDRIGAQRAQAEVELEWAINQTWPALDVLASTSADFGPGDPKRGEPVFEVGVVLDVPLAGRRERGRVQTQRAAVRKLEQQATMHSDRISAEVRDAESALVRAHERVVALEEEVKAAEELEAAERRRFDVGDGTLLFVNLREQATVEAQVRLVDARVDFQKALVLYRYALGTP